MMTPDELFRDEYLICDNCGFEYLHLFEIEPAANGTDGRFGVELSFWCESCGDVTVLSILNHKGNTRFDRSSYCLPEHIFAGALPVGVRLGAVVLPWSSRFEQR